MEKMKTPNFFLVIVAIIVGSALFKQFDFETLKFEKPALAIVYLIVFVVTIYWMVKKKKKESEE